MECQPRVWFTLLTWSVGSREIMGYLERYLIWDMDWMFISRYGWCHIDTWKSESMLGCSDGTEIPLSYCRSVVDVVAIYYGRQGCQQNRVSRIDTLWLVNRNVFWFSGWIAHFWVFFTPQEHRSGWIRFAVFILIEIFPCKLKTNQ